VLAEPFYPGAAARAIKDYVNAGSHTDLGELQAESDPSPAPVTLASHLSQISWD